MKKRHIVVVAFLQIIIISAFCAEPIKFETYKQLSLTERQQVAGESSLELHKTYKRWDEIISMGGKWWNPAKQGEYLIKAKKLNGLYGISNTQILFWGYFYFHEVARNKKAGMTTESAEKAAAAISFTTAIDKERYKDHWWYLVKLAPTPEALALNEKASALQLDLHRRYGDGQTITIDDLNNMDAEVKEIRDEMRKLPQLTPEQIESALAALPESDGPQRMKEPQPTSDSSTPMPDRTTPDLAPRLTSNLTPTTPAKNLSPTTSSSIPLVAGILLVIAVVGGFFLYRRKP